MLTLATIQPLIQIMMDPSVIETNRHLRFAFELLRLNDVTQFLALLAIGVAVIYATRGIYLYFLTVMQNRFLARNRVSLSNRLLKQTLKQSYLYHVNHNVAELQRIVSTDVNRLFNLITSVLALLTDSFMSLFILIFLFTSSAHMTLVVLFFSAICIFVYFKIFKARIKASGDQEAKGTVQITKAALQSFNGIKEIKISRREDYFTNKFRAVSEGTVNVMQRLQSLMQLPKLFIESLCFSGAFVVVSATILVGVDMQALVPQLGLFVLAGFKLLPAISRFVNNTTQILRFRPSVSLVYKSLFEQDEEYNHPMPEPIATVISQDITISNLTFTYPKIKKPVLKNISLVIPSNKSIALVGPSGAGKTTLVDILLGILMPHQGGVFYDGKSVHHNFDDWAKNVGYIPQVIYLLDETILENVAFGIESDKIDEEKVWRALEQAQLKEFVLSLPDRLATKVGDRGVRLSGGQRQRLGIARALYSDPPILVLDEATASLDNKTEKAVMESIKGLQGSKTMIIVAHRLSTIEHCDIVFRVADGTVVQERIS